MAIFLMISMYWVWGWRFLWDQVHRVIILLWSVFYFSPCFWQHPQHEGTTSQMSSNLSRAQTSTHEMLKKMLKKSSKIFGEPHMSLSFHDSCMQLHRIYIYISYIIGCRSSCHWTNPFEGKKWTYVCELATLMILTLGSGVWFTKHERNT